MACNVKGHWNWCTCHEAFT